MSPIEYTYQLFDQVKTPKQLVMYQGERHAIGRPAGGLGATWMTLVVDWLRDRADGTAMASQRVDVRRRPRGWARTLGGLRSQ